MSTKQRPSLARRIRQFLQFSRWSDRPAAKQPQHTFRARTSPLNVPRPPGYNHAGGSNGSPRQSSQEDRPTLKVVNGDVSQATSSQSRAPSRPKPRRSGSSLQDWLRNPDAVGSSDFIPVLNETPGDTQTTPVPLYPRSGSRTAGGQCMSPRPARLEDIGTAWHNRSGGWSAADLFGDWKLWKDVNGTAVYQPAMSETAKPNAEQVVADERSTALEGHLASGLQSEDQLGVYDTATIGPGRTSVLSASRMANIPDGGIPAQEREKASSSVAQPPSLERSSGTDSGADSTPQDRSLGLKIRLGFAPAPGEKSLANEPNSSGGVYAWRINDGQSTPRSGVKESTSPQTSGEQAMQQYQNRIASAGRLLPASDSTHELLAFAQAYKMSSNDMPKAQQPGSGDGFASGEEEKLRRASKRRWRAFRNTGARNAIPPAAPIARTTPANGESSPETTTQASTSKRSQDPKTEVFKLQNTPKIGVTGILTTANASHQRRKHLRDEAHARFTQLKTPVISSDAVARELEGSVLPATNAAQNDIQSPAVRSLDAESQAIADSDASYLAAEQRVADPHGERRREAVHSPVQTPSSTPSPALVDTSTSLKSRWTKSRWIIWNKS